MYQIGIICIGQNFIINTYANGMECTILKPLQEAESYNLESGIVTRAKQYYVEWEDGSTTWVQPNRLRPKHEPGSWDDEVFDELGWNPARIEQ